MGQLHERVALEPLALVHGLLVLELLKRAFVSHADLLDRVGPGHLLQLVEDEVHLFLFLLGGSVDEKSELHRPHEEGDARKLDEEVFAALARVLDLVLRVVLDRGLAEQGRDVDSGPSGDGASHLPAASEDFAQQDEILVPSEYDLLLVVNDLVLDVLLAQPLVDDFRFAYPVLPADELEGRVADGRLDSLEENLVELGDIGLISGGVARNESPFEEAKLFVEAAGDRAELEALRNLELALLALLETDHQLGLGQNLTSWRLLLSARRAIPDSLEYTVMCVIYSSLRRVIFCSETPKSLEGLRFRGVETCAPCSG